MNLKELQEQTIAKITDDLEKLNVAQLKELRALEQNETTPRTSLIKVLDTAIEAAEPAAPDTVPTKSESEPAAAKPPWQAYNYDGPLSGDQAQWRMHNLPEFQKQVVRK